MFSTQKECEEKKESFSTAAEMEKKYGVLTSMDEVDKMLDKWTPPRRQAPAATKNIKFYAQTKESLRNTIFYMFYKYILCFYVCVRGGHCKIHYVYNSEWVNPLAEYIKLPKIWGHHDPKKINNLGAVFTAASTRVADSYTMDFTYFPLLAFMDELVANREIYDCDFVLAGRDRLNIKKDLTEASEELAGHIKLPQKFLFEKYTPILSFCGSSTYADIPISTPADWVRILDKFPMNECKNIYRQVDLIDWNARIPKAVFRGSYTGQYCDIRNPRIHVSVLNSKPEYKNLLDAGISGWKGRWRARKSIEDEYLCFLHVDMMKYEVPPLNHQEQAKFKYILYIEGNVSAYRGAFLFSMGCVVLWVCSKKYFLWFEEKLIDKKNCVFIRNDLSDLKKNIEWLQKNDAAAMSIAAEGRKFFDEFLSKEPIINHMRDTLNSLQQYID